MVKTSILSFLPSTPALSGCLCLATESRIFCFYSIYFNFRIFFNRKGLTIFFQYKLLKPQILKYLQTKFNKGEFMKRLFETAVGGLSAVGLWAAAGMDSEFSFDTSVQFQTEYVYRGRNEFRKAFTPKIKNGYQVNDETNIYSGIGSALGIESENGLNHVSLYPRVSYAVTYQYTVDAGFKYHSYTLMIKASAKRNSSEIYGFKYHFYTASMISSVGNLR
ncbi:MAG: hypothetical protein LBQ23_02585 [Puniceicoccales bacterium]|jgi:hypothetical protein|nr:hypothetical protein [Puniceicoccales bacterium]